MKVIGAERQLLDILRQVSNKNENNFDLTIGRVDGAWEIKMSLPPHGARGVGKTFDEAWEKMDPLWLEH